jgi:hypothetical protein
VKKGKEPTFARNPLNLKQVSAIAEGLAFDIQEEDAIARLLLLCHALTYELDATEREGMLQAIEKEAAPMFRAVDETLNEVKRRELEALSVKR